MTYNALKFPGANGAGRLSYFQTVFETSEPDILIMQEIENEDGADMLLTTLNANGIQYARAEFVLTDTFYTANMLFYKTSKANLISQDIIETPRRDIAEYVIFIDGNPIRFYSCHLKSSEGSQNELKRLVEITCLRNHLNNLEQGTEFIIVGDMNFYTSSEPAYQKIIADESNNIGRGQDLSDQVGNWHNDSTYTEVHSQSTRVNQFGGGVGGGLDDRFDFIFTSYEINNESGIEYIDSSLIYFGNDGNHFNQSVNYGTNSAVPDSVADALYYASDHLPVFADFVSLDTLYTIYGIQYTTDPGYEGTYPSLLEGETVTTSGIVTGTYDANGSTKFYLTQPEGGEWKGIFVYNTNSSYNPALGDEVQLIAEVYEYYGMTELKNILSFEIFSNGNTIPDAFFVSTQQVATEESLEGVLIKVSNVIVTQVQNPYGEWYVDDGTGECQIDDVFCLLEPVGLGQFFGSIKGLVNYSYGEYDLNPRSSDDLPVDQSFSPNSELSLKLFPNPFHDNIKIELYYDNYNLPKPSIINIYNIKGQLLREIKMKKAKDKNIIEWNGKDKQGNEVENGIYLIQFIYDNQNIGIQKVVKLY